MNCEIPTIINVLLEIFNKIDGFLIFLIINKTYKGNFKNLIDRIKKVKITKDVVMLDTPPTRKILVRPKDVLIGNIYSLKTSSEINEIPNKVELIKFGNSSAELFVKDANTGRKFKTSRELLFEEI